MRFIPYWQDTAPVFGASTPGPVEGSYDVAGRTLRVRLKGNTLIMDSEGQRTLTLVPDRDNGFKIKEQSANSIRFKTGKDEADIELALETAGGVFASKRQAK